VRIGNLADSSLIARRIAPVRRVLLASPAYLAQRGQPEHPRDLTRHDVLLYTYEDRWRFRVGNRWEYGRGQPRMRANNGELLRAAACAGLGICILPSFIAAPAIESGELEVLLRDFPLEEGALHAVMPPGRATTARVRALVDHFVARFGPEPGWDPCWRAKQAKARRMQPTR
jgi:DNA-binding transcriptional LysR family regulator